MPSGREERIALEVTAEDDASRILERVAEQAEGLERADPEVTIGADDNATRVLEDVAAEVAELARRDHEVALTARVGDLRAALATAEADLARVRGAADDTQRSIGDIGSQADQSRSVLANMAGNATQDIGELGGVAGTAGVAIGQLAEYATEGNIALGNLAKTALPMLALAGAVKLLTDHMAGLRAAREEARKLAEANEKVIESLRAGEARKAAGELVETYEDLFDAADALGVPMAEVLEVMTGQSDEAPSLAAAIAEVTRQIEAEERAVTAGTTAGQSRLAQLRDDRRELEGLAGDVQAGRTAWDSANASLDTTAARTNVAARHLGELGTTAADTAADVAELTAEYERLQGRLDDEASYLSAQSSLDAVADAVAEAVAATAEYGAQSEEAQDANRRLAEQLNTAKGDVLGYAEAIGGIPPEQATEITALIDEGQYAAAEMRLAALEQERTARVNLEVIYGRNRPLGYPVGAPWPPAAAAAGATNVTVNLPAGARGADVVRSVNSWARRNGGVRL